MRRVFKVVGTVVLVFWVGVFFVLFTFVKVMEWLGER
jgi:hypothetical protein